MAARMRPTAGRGIRSPAPGFDRSVPLLLVKVGHYPLGYCGIGAVRSLGRAGVPVYAMTEDRFTPLARSRYLTGAFVAPTTGREEPPRLVEVIRRVQRELGRPAVVLPTDDEAAVLLAEHAARVRARLHDAARPSIAPARAREQARSLRDVRRARVPDARRGVPDLDRRGGGLRAPSAASRSWRRTSIPSAGWSRPRCRTRSSWPRRTISSRLAKEWADPPGVVFQEYVPDGVSEDWIFHGYFDASSECVVGFTGVKYRSWPPRTRRHDLRACRRERRPRGGSARVRARSSDTAASSISTSGSTGGTAATSCSTSIPESARSSACSRPTPASTWSARCTSISPGARYRPGDPSRGADSSSSTSTLPRSSAYRRDRDRAGLRSPRARPHRAGVVRGGRPRCPRW